HCADVVTCFRFCYILIIASVPFFFFFFSSRRRHTRFSRDWSSDVCSSDLVLPNHVPLTVWAKRFQDADRAYWKKAALNTQLEQRSEERRVGKECRSRGWA